MQKSKIKKLIPRSILYFYHWFIAVIASIVFYHPRKLRIIGVTGTDGKTTTTAMIYEMLKAAGLKAALCNGLFFKIAGLLDEKNPTDNTTPSPWILHKFIKRAKLAGCDYLVIEVTSWALVQYRLLGVPFDSAAMTNVTHEHTDVHGNFENYRNAKGRLFKKIASSERSVSVVNGDDPSAEFFYKFPARTKFVYSVQGIAGMPSGEKIMAKEIQVTGSGSSFVVEYLGQKYPVILKLPGIYNISNALAAFAVCLGEGIDLKKAIGAVLLFKGVPGRFEEVNCGQDFRIVVDFGHTPNAFRQVFSAIKTMTPKGKLIAVFGAAGGRDSLKRPMLGAVAGEFADFCVLTTDDPRYEDPEQIAGAIATGLEKQGKTKDKDFMFIKDRKQAIFKALSMARSGDTVALMSMGAYDMMYVGDSKVPWSDRGAVEEYFNKSL